MRRDQEAACDARVVAGRPLCAGDGSYRLLGLPDGEQPIGEVLRSGWSQTYPGGNGFHTVTLRTFKPMTDGQLNQIAFELDRYLKEVRAEQPPLADTQAVQKRARTISRLNNALIILRNFLHHTRR